MTAWQVRFDPPMGGTDGLLRIAVKDAFDLAGQITTAGCVAVRDRAVPATTDAACLAGMRATETVFIAGKTTLTEMCLSPVEINDQFGTPVNPVAGRRIPGGSSSGSAVAVAAGEADIGLGTDSGGSVRIPAACCGIVGLKTTWGRISTAGVWPLAPSLDVVGPLARDNAGIRVAMTLLEPGWTMQATPAGTVGRLRIDGVDPMLEEAIDAALAVAGFTVRPVTLPGWEDCWADQDAILLGELWRVHSTLLDADGVTEAVNNSLRVGSRVTDEQLATAMSGRRRWQAEVTAALGDVQLLALPTLVGSPPLLTEIDGFPYTLLTAPFNLAGLPALAMPVPSPGFEVPISLQLVGPMNGEGLLCATGLAVETALAGYRP